RWFARGHSDKLFAIPSKSAYRPVEAAGRCQLELAVMQRPTTGGSNVRRKIEAVDFARGQKVICHDLLLIKHVVPAKQQQSRAQMGSLKSFLHGVRRTATHAKVQKNEGFVIVPEGKRLAHVLPELVVLGQQYPQTGYYGRKNQNDD